MNVKTSMLALGAVAVLSSYSAPPVHAQSIIAIVFAGLDIQDAQIIQRDAATLQISFEPEAGHDAGLVWERLEARLRAFLAEQGLSAIRLERSAEPPLRDPESGKLRRILAQPGGATGLASKH